MLRWTAIVTMLGAAPAFAQDAAAPSADAPLTDAPLTDVERLVHALIEDESFKVRLQAALLLGRSNDDRAVEPLMQALTTDQHYTVRAAAATALANLKDPESIPSIMVALATDAESFVREEAARALRVFERDDAVAYVVAAYGSEDSRVRGEAVRYLADGDFDAAELVFVRALGDEPRIATIARGVVKKMELAERLRFLTTAVEHRDPSVRRGAVEALHTEGSPEAAQVVLRVYERDIELDQVRAATRSALRDLRSHLPMARIVDDARSNPDKHVRARALKLLGVVGGAEAQDALLTTLGDKEVYLRGTAVMALRELGDPAFIPQLEKLLRDPANHRISLQIRTAVKHLRNKQSAPN